VNLIAGENELQLDVSSLPPDIYLVKIKSEETDQQWQVSIGG
jgi:hypothetical protein